MATKLLSETFMRNRFTIAILLVAGFGLITTIWLSAQLAPLRPAQAQTYRAPRLADGHPDLNGIWQAFVTANWDLQDHEAQPGPHPEIMGAYGAGPAGQSVVEGGEIPYQTWALEKK